MHLVDRFKTRDFQISKERKDVKVPNDFKPIGVGHPRAAVWCGTAYAMLTLPPVASALIGSRRSQEKQGPHSSTEILIHTLRREPLYGHDYWEYQIVVTKAWFARY